MKHSKSGLFLMELVIAILFFSLASTVCIQMFARAHLLSAKTVNESHALQQAQNLAESWLATDGDFDRLAALFPEGVCSREPDGLILYFDQNWNSCGETQGKFAARITGQPINEQNTVTASILVWSFQQTGETLQSSAEDAPVKETLQPSGESAPAKELYALSLTHHIPQRRGRQ